MQIVRKVERKGQIYIVTVDIDTDQLADYLSERAAYNKTRRARLAYATAKAELRSWGQPEKGA